MPARLTETEYARLKSKAAAGVRFVESAEPVSRPRARRRSRPGRAYRRQASPWRDLWPALAAIGGVALLGFIASRESNLRGLSATQTPTPQLSVLVNDLLGMQSEVQQYAPQLSSRWGWLAQQGKSLVAGSGASIAPSVWLSEYRQFFSDLQDALPDQNQMVAQNFTSNAASDASQGFPQGLTADAETYGDAAQSVGQGISTATAGAGNLLQTLEADAVAAVPWVVGGVLAILLLPELISVVRGK